MELNDYMKAEKVSNSVPYPEPDDASCKYLILNLRQYADALENGDARVKHYLITTLSEGEIDVSFHLDTEDLTP